jgi:hypothetical protein
MNINSIHKNANIYHKSDSKGKNSINSSDNAVRSNSIIDKVEISSEARRLGSIQNKIDQGFYDRPEVIRQVASNLSNDL